MAKRHSKDRDGVVQVARALRESIRRALAAADTLTGRDMRVLLAIHCVLATWTRVEDDIYTKELSDLTGLPPNKVRESVAKLVDVGAIWRTPSKGRHPSRYGLPAPTESTPSAGSIQTSTLPVAGASTLPTGGEPVRGGPPRKTLAAASAAAGAVPVEDSSDGDWDDEFDAFVEAAAELEEAGW